MKRNPPSRINHVEDSGSKKVSINKDSTLPINEGMPDMMYKLLLQHSGPDIEVDVFDGNPSEFNYFMSLFEEVVESKVEDPIGRLTRLIKFTRGESKELVKHCIQQPREFCYENPKSLMRKRYGNPHKILTPYGQEIKKWPQLKPGDAVAYKKFFNFLIKCESLTD